MEKTDFDIKMLINYMEKEYGIDHETVISIIEQSILKSARKNPRFTNDLKIKVGDDSKIHVYDTVVVSDEEEGPGFITIAQGRKIKKGIPVGEGDIMDIEYPSSLLGRACARESRMLILQKMKLAKDTNIIDQYRTRVGDIVSGSVSGIEKGNIIFTVNGKTEMVIPRNEKIQKETYKIGDSISGVIIGINEKQRNSPIMVSRSSNRFLEELLKREVTEIGDGTIEVLKISRNPGFRAKILVKSNKDKIDPVGACVGKKGSRINIIVNELSGEKIDIIKYSNNIEELVRSAFSPSKVESVSIDRDNNIATITVSKEQYANAVGKFGANVRLVSEIIGMKINIKKSVLNMTFDEQKNYAIANLSDLLGISIITAESLVNSGYLTPEGIASDDVVSLMAATGIDEVTASGVYAAAKAVVQVMTK